MTADTTPKAAKAARAPGKLTRQQIKEGMTQFPVEHLLSAGPGKRPQLTTKQREFARQLALGQTQAEAYRRSRDSKGSAITQGNHASRLAKDARIQTEVDAYRLAIEAEKHRTPQQLKSLLVQQLVQHSLDPEFPPAQRVACLKLLGSLFEVGAFVERKEVTTIQRSGEIRARLLETLRDVTDVTATRPADDQADEGLDLLTELAQARSQASQDDDAAEAGTSPDDGAHADPTPPPPAHSGPADGVAPSHSVPLKESPEKTDGGV